MTKENIDGLAWRDVCIVIEGRAVTIEDLARAWASIDGKRDEFDAGKGVPIMRDETGHYAGYMVEAKEMVGRALCYAVTRANLARDVNG